jgi:riboflavin kinase / FMN adenylyltransferase
MMNVAAQVEGVENAALPAKPLHLAVGMFDGVHRGHRAVIEAAVHGAHAANGVAGVLTFYPHPSTLFRPENPTPLIHDTRTKARALASLGVEVVITQPFTAAFAAVTAENFLPWLKERLPHLSAVYVGENFRFGQARQGDALLLLASARRHGLAAVSLPRVQCDDQPVSSTRVRAQLAAGDITAANALLGYDYFSDGVVAPGKRLGRTIGFPTLNLAWNPELRPRLGVYAVRVSGPHSSAPLPAVANYGLRPTVEQATEPRLEVHVLGACPFAEGDEISVRWLRFLRPEMKFASLDELRAQIARDRDAAEKFFRE